MKYPTIKELRAVLIACKKEIRDEYRAPGCEAESTPSMQVTLAGDGETWGLQTGDNSYTGVAYSYPRWAVGELTRTTNCTDMAKEMIAELRDMIEEESDYE